MMATALARPVTPWDWHKLSAISTVPVDASQPTKVRAQKGTTSRHRWLLPPLRHAHLRLSSYDAGVATKAPMVLATMPDRPNTHAHTRIVVWLMTMATADTMEYRMNFGTEPLP